MLQSFAARRERLDEISRTQIKIGWQSGYGGGTQGLFNGTA
jgi:hypothetical protein